LVLSDTAPADRIPGNSNNESEDEKARNRRKRWALVKRFRFLYFLLGIIVVYYAIFVFTPVVIGVIMSFKEMKIGNTILGSTWVGFANFKMITSNPQIMQTVRNTILLSIYRLFWGFWPPIILAIMMYDLLSRKFRRVSQTIVYLPYFFSWVIVYGIVFSMLSTNGLLNGLLIMLGGDRISFLTENNLFRSVLIGSQIWKNAGWGTILYFAALANVNLELYEAARIDGAGPLRRIQAVTLPTIMPVVIFSLILNLGNILNVDFEQVLLFQNAAVMDVSDIIDTWVFRIGIGKMQFGVGAAVGLAKGLIGFVLILVTNSISHRVAGRGMF